MGWAIGRLAKRFGLSRKALLYYDRLRRPGEIIAPGPPCFLRGRADRAWRQGEGCMGWTIGRLAKRFGLSRSTLLYYDRLGLFSPSGGRSAGDYRSYTEEDAERLARILRYRRAGLPLAEIKAALDAPETRLSAALEQRLDELDREAEAIREQRGLIMRLLGGSAEHGVSGDARDEQVMTRELLTSLMRAAGLDDEDMRRLHAAFEHSDPEKHRKFLAALRIPDHEIALIRAWAVAP